MRKILLKSAAAVVVMLLSQTMAEEQILLGGVKCDLGASWKLQPQEAKKKAGFEAVWVNPKTNKPNAALIAKMLTKSVADEAGEMAKSAEKQPQAIKLLEDRTVELKAGGVARIVSLSVMAGNPQLNIESPMVFHSIYVPSANGNAVTFKLLCAMKELEGLKLDFERSVLKDLSAP